jgi:hypothetical protein
LAISGSPLAASDWPRFRGPFGRSSPVVSRECVFVAAGEGDQLITAAYDVRSGRILWQRQTGRKHRHELFRASDPASPTPAVDDSHVYGFFPGLGLIAYDFQGNGRWPHPLGPDSVQS